MAIGGFIAPSYHSGYTEPPSPTDTGHGGSGTVIGSSPGFNPVTGQAYSAGIPGPIIRFGLTKEPPGPCRLAMVDLPAGYDGSDQDLERALAALSPIGRSRINAAVAKWSRDFPQAPPAQVVITSHSMGAVAGTNVIDLTWGVAVARPSTEYDPILDTLGAPVIPVGDPKRPDAVKFAAALRLFFPDFVLDPMTGANLTGPQVGSMTIYGPFPRRVNYVSPAMVDLAVAVAQMPGAFQAGTVGGSSGPDFLGSIETGLKATAASKGNIYVGAGAAAAKFIISAFDWLFSGPPQPPAWLTALLQMKQLRGDTTELGVWSFYSYRFGVYEQPTSPWPCSIAAIHPNPRGTMTIEQGYDAFIRRLGGGGLGDVPWLLLGALGLGGYLLTE